MGLALGAAIAGDHGYYRGGYGYGGPYYGGYGGYYDEGYAVCTGRRTVWDPYVGGYIVQRFHYAC